MVAHLKEANHPVTTLYWSSLTLHCLLIIFIFKTNYLETTLSLLMVPPLYPVSSPPPFLTEGAALQKDNGDFDQIFKIGKLSFQVNYRTKYKMDGD